MTTDNTNTTMAIAFLGASTGVGLAALTRALAAGHTCVALCRKPAKLTSRFPAAAHPNLRVVEGNAHDAAAVAQCLRITPSRLVDAVVSSVGGAFVLSRMTLDDPDVCRRAAATLVEAIGAVRREQVEGGDTAAARAWKPRVVAVSSAGLARTGRDYPLALAPVYRLLLKAPHADKAAMERVLVDGAAATGGGYVYTLVRPSLLVDEANPRREVRAGVDDEFPVGWNISRDDAGRWVYENLLGDAGVAGGYEGRVVTVTW
ncbi:NAD(P)-binding protein [Hypoxylon sp. FL1284]|nr:NAD(P)-binding protein [Hypoxylon sp. FL1284]